MKYSLFGGVSISSLIDPPWPTEAREQYYRRPWWITNWTMNAMRPLYCYSPFFLS
jgi:hypothetical protein